ncbi:hypothetical protein M406DRAFT_321206 [Cryphonectria parasitica EP155]|uniref:Uncharacterized protein n=1 Tax=Cryphonectria parasitica (strain ATCC 38755 / EP155) TaxID=660469 RepID=A0A9P4Y9Z8_CRYP1|nr:uncharacterized protein M406DRAFT_321206 [Cryphonectria parasitica EP155]KAF3769211.1 hypothetical protein M406DRAFT_321206 [Cryphonectria parasitica EP155]
MPPPCHSLLSSAPAALSSPSSRGRCSGWCGSCKASASKKRKRASPSPSLSLPPESLATPFPRVSPPITPTASLSRERRFLQSWVQYAPQQAGARSTCAAASRSQISGARIR